MRTMKWGVKITVQVGRFKPQLCHSLLGYIWVLVSTSAGWLKPHADLTGLRRGKGTVRQPRAGTQECSITVS